VLHLDAIDLLLKAVPIWVLGILLVAVCLLAVEFGIWWAKGQMANASPGHKPLSSETLGLVLGSVFGLLALLISLSFSLALDRYDERRVLAATEANAIRTAYLRADLFSEPVGGQLKAALRSYTQSRVIPENIALSELKRHDLASMASEDQLWRSAKQATYKERDTDLSADFIDATNEIIDIARLRTLAGQAHIPGSILDAMFLSLVLTSALIGVLLAKEGTRYRYASTIIIVQYVLGILLITDLDRPHAGTILVSQQGLQDLLVMMGQDEADAARSDN
jgi:hypothetical protein